jgi:hypothetical protein
VRLEQITIRDVYHVHKLWVEWMNDTEQPMDLGEASDLSRWLVRFSDPRFYCYQAIHGKLRVGQVWGMACDSSNKLTVEGIFIRRGFRGKLRPVRLLTDKLLDLAKGAVALSAIVPENQRKRLTRHGFQVKSLLMEFDLGEGAKWHQKDKRKHREPLQALEQARWSARPLGPSAQ